MRFVWLLIKNAGVYSILADETKDCSKREQLAIVLRYVDTESATVFERFLTYIEATSLNAESLSKYILDTLKEHGLDPQNIISQGYDGASVMSGCCSGVQQRIKEIAPQAVYVHCYAHCLNLVLVDCTKSVYLMLLNFSRSWKLSMYSCQQAKYIHCISRNRVNYTQPNKFINCNGFQIHVGLVDTWL